MSPGQMSLWQFSIVKEKHGKLPLLYDQNLMSKSRDIADIDFPVVVGGGGVKSFLCQTQLL